MEISEQIAAGILNGIVVAGAAVLVWLLNRSWAQRMREMNEDWENRCQKINVMWKDTCTEMIDEHKKQVGAMFDRWSQATEDMRKERNEALDRLHEGWERAVRATIDQMEDRYFKYTKRVIDLRDPARRS